MRFLDVKTDYAFKRVFGATESIPLLINFLNAILDYTGEDAIVDLVILDPYLAPKLAGMKDTYVDVRAKLANGNSVIIEMQVLNVEGFEKRVLYNATKEYAKQLNSGERYHLLNPVIALTFTNFLMFKEFEQYQSSFVLMEQQTLAHYNGDIELIFVELPKFNKTIDDLADIKDKWIYFLKNAGNLTAIPASLKEPCIEDAFERVNEGAMTPEELEIQRKRNIYIQDQLGAMSLALRQGLERGIAEGLEQGLEQGLEKGREEGRQAERHALIKQAYENGMPTHLIASFVDMPESDVIDLLRQILPPVTRR
jgi:predicted transposase/invertase (TIGR01784 family)